MKKKSLCFILIIYNNCFEYDWWPDVGLFYQNFNNIHLRVNLYYWSVLRLWFVISSELPWSLAASWGHHTASLCVFVLIEWPGEVLMFRPEVFWTWSCSVNMFWLDPWSRVKFWWQHVTVLTHSEWTGQVGSGGQNLDPDREGPGVGLALDSLTWRQN